MQKQNRKRLRWDRIALVGGVALVAAYGVAAVVPEGENYNGTDSEGRMAAVLAPGSDDDAGTAVLQAQESIAENSRPAPLQEVTPPPVVEEASVGPAPSGPLPRKGIAPCSCSKYTMKLARNPYTQHQKRARSLPGSFFVNNESALQAGISRR